MGGKSNLLDSSLLSALYQESLHFNEQADAKMKVIQKELNKLNDVLLHKGMLESQASALTRDAVLCMIDSVTSLKESMDATEDFIEIRLADSVLIEKEVQAGKGTIGTIIGRFQGEQYLKK